MGVETKTKIDESKLAEWQRKLPEQKIFLGNFFESCRPYSQEDNLANYETDIELYGIGNRRDELMQAYKQITEQ